MRVGLSLFFQNYYDWGRFEAREEEAPIGLDAGIYEDEISLADMASEYGFDSLWTVEHRVSPYTLVPDPSVMLAYLAGRTHLDIGTMVIVLPWHDPLQTAEHITMLDNLLQGGRLTIGFGRGAGRREFDALRVSMSESRGRFLEALEVVRKALTQERFSAPRQVLPDPRDDRAPAAAQLRLAGPHVLRMGQPRDAADRRRGRSEHARDPPGQLGGVRRPDAAIQLHPLRARLRPDSADRRVPCVLPRGPG